MINFFLLKQMYATVLTQTTVFLLKMHCGKPHFFHEMILLKPLESRLSFLSLFLGFGSSINSI